MLGGLGIKGELRPEVKGEARLEAKEEVILDTKGGGKWFLVAKGLLRAPTGRPSETTTTLEVKKKKISVETFSDHTKNDEI